MNKIVQSVKPRHKWVQISTKRWQCSICGCKKNSLGCPYPEYLKDGHISRRSPECISVNSKIEK